MTEARAVPLAAPVLGRLSSRLVAPAGWAALVLLGRVLGGRLYDHDPLEHIGAPPLVGSYDVRIGLALLPALALAASAWAWGPALARRVSWRALLAGSWLATASWSVALAAGDGLQAIARPLTTRYEYLAAVPLVRSPGHFLEHFTGALATYPTHVKGHPPGMVLLLWAADRVGLGGADAAAVLVIAVGAAAAPAVLLAVRSLGGELAARQAAPFLAFAPAAVWMATSADALFTGVAATGIAAFVLATEPGRRAPSAVALAALAGVVLAAGLLLSYGLAPLYAIPLVVALHRRSVRVAAIAATVALLVLGAFGALGFWWPDGLHATRALYLSGVAARRPYADFIVIDAAALALSAGPAVAAALARRPRSAAHVLPLAALGALAVATLSGMSRGEVERIWLPYVPWLLVATISLRGARGWLGVQLALGLALQAGVRSPW